MAKIKWEYSPNNIFNANEIVIFYKTTTDKTLKFKGEKSVGGKLSEERITVFVVTNMSDTKNRKIMVIDKQKNFRSFENIKRLLTYKAKKSA